MDRVRQGSREKQRDQLEMSRRMSRFLYVLQTISYPVSGTNSRNTRTNKPVIGPSGTGWCYL